MSICDKVSICFILMFSNFGNLFTILDQKLVIILSHFYMIYWILPNLCLHCSACLFTCRQQLYELLQPWIFVCVCIFLLLILKTNVLEFTTVYCQLLPNFIIMTTISLLIPTVLIFLCHFSTKMIQVVIYQIWSSLFEACWIHGLVEIFAQWRTIIFQLICICS